MYLVTNKGCSLCFLLNAILSMAKIFQSTITEFLEPNSTLFKMTTSIQDFFKIVRNHIILENRVTL